IAWRCFYNLYLHPLAKFPGPKLAAISPLWFSVAALSGKQAEYYKEVHRKYGSVVRVAQNDLSFTSPAAWKDIHSHHAGQPTFIKAGFYYQDPKHLTLPNIINEANVAKHAQVRRLHAPAFSAKALKEQETIIDRYINLLVQRLWKRYADRQKGPDGEYCNFVDWYNYTTFDAIGDLAFGDSTAFACLENERSHPWVSTLLDSIFFLGSRDVFRCYPFMVNVGNWLTPKKITNVRARSIKYSREMVKQCMSKETDRKDFMNYMVQCTNDPEFSQVDFAANAQVLIAAGAETTSTLLSGVTYYIMKTRNVYQRLKEEIRSSFQNYWDINSLTTQQLPYLNTVIEEGLRIYPPVPIGLPRVSPGAVVDGHYIPAGVTVSVHGYAVTHNPDNFKDPDTFIPERWLPECKFNDKKEASQPFLLGPRTCIGTNVAYLEIRVILAKLIYCYDFDFVRPDLD
ncbi:putative cytochrome P450, partial [Kalaharituber pfeilii]